jgi:anthranilate phosphoribosyltransferase
MTTPDFKSVLQQLVGGGTLDEAAAHAAVSAIMAGQVGEPQIASFLTAIALRRETTDELVGAARAMRDHLTPVVHTHGLVLDTCGTGGDGADTFNISTTVAFVCAAAGAPVAKHGNRSASSRVGSADVLEAAGVRIDLPPERASELFETLGYCFMFAPVHHGAMRHAATVRRALGFRTLFNLLGPLSNPAAATHQLLGVHDPARLTAMATVLGRLGATRALVVHGPDGLDELGLAGPSEGVLWDAGTLTTIRFEPEMLGLATAPVSALRGGTAADNADIMLDILSGKSGARADIVALNAGVALWVAERAPSAEAGVRLARKVMASGAARDLFERYRSGSRS